MRPSLVLFVVLVSLTVVVGCGGDPAPQQAPATPAAPAAPPRPPEPPKRVARPAADVLHGAPEPSEDELGELYDIGRDLNALAQGESGAVASLAEDLARFAPEGMPTGEVQGLAGDLGTALQGKKPDATATYRLSILLYDVMNGDALSAAQRTALATDLRSTLTTAGAAAAPASAAAARVNSIAAAVTAASK